MAQLNYHRWINNFNIDYFSSEDSMRDYLSSNPSLFFEENDWVIPIKEEKHLPLSSINKRSGRADIILCKMPDSYDVIKSKTTISLSDIELWDKARVEKRGAKFFY